MVDASSGLVEFLIHILLKRHTQYKSTLEKLESLLEKVKNKTEKAKDIRDEKKVKLKDKITSGEFLPKDEYDKVRKEKQLEREKKKQEEKEAAKLARLKEKEEESEDVAKLKKHMDKNGKFKSKDEKAEKSYTRFKKDRDDNHFDKAEEKKGFTKKIKDFKKEKASAGQKPKKPQLHPSWQAKQEETYRDTHIEFVQNQIFEF